MYQKKLSLSVWGLIINIYLSNPHIPMISILYSRFWRAFLQHPRRTKAWIKLELFSVTVVGTNNPRVPWSKNHVTKFRLNGSTWSDVFAKTAGRARRRSFYRLQYLNGKMHKHNNQNSGNILIEREQFSNSNFKIQIQSGSIPKTGRWKE